MRSISPPPLRRSKQGESSQVAQSPFQLTRIRDLPPSSNVDAVSLKDILEDPLIAECWEFNYLHDLDFLMDAFDADVRDIVKVHVIHGFWKNEDQTRLALKVCPNLWTNHTEIMH
jgi:tyrosyl-DNA phosphodiesterase-1